MINRKKVYLREGLLTTRFPLMTGQGTIETAIEAKKAGAFDYVLKPFKLDELLLTVSHAMEAHQYKIQGSRQFTHISSLTR